jgi:membrane protein required for colicin V production
MNYLDVIIALPLLWGVYRGFTKGLIISVASLMALILGVYAAIHFSSFFGEYINKWFHPDPKHLKALSFALTFVLVVLIVRLIGWGLDKLIKAAALGLVNRLLGVFFNLLKWAFIISILISIVDSAYRTKSIINEDVKKESILYEPVSMIAPFVFPYLKFDKLKERIEIQTKTPSDTNPI